nr:MAG TPA: putative transporter [Caudoviricetes sp.]
MVSRRFLTLPCPICAASTTPPGRMPSTPRSGRRMRQGKTSLFIRA